MGETAATPRPQAPGSQRETAPYRADIDGLRALAVGAVILTHAGVSGFRGGFIGVDVFFVISGYLIHRDLLRRAAAGRLSVLGFYGRRLRRTMPALIAVVVAVFVAALMVFMPGDLDALARSVIGAVCLVPNIVLLSETGYFDQAAAAKPLLHSWSLGVEEQFYLLAPLFALALGAVAAERRRFVLGATLLGAFVLCLAIGAESRDAAFYLMPARAFELLIGVAIAERDAPLVRSRPAAEIVAASGLAGLAVSVAIFSAALPHPGFPTLLPCLATAALIENGKHHRTAVARMLASRGLAALGLISYSLYLWHWPILVFARDLEAPQSWPWLVGELVLLLALATASWRYIEQPFRAPGSPWRRRAPLLIPAAVASVIGVAATTIALRGFPMRFAPEIASVAAYYDFRDQQPFREGQCFITSKNRLADFDRGTCLGLSATKPNVLLLGDSHAAQLWTGLRDAWPAINFLQATASGCKPVFATEGAGRCTAMMGEMLRDFIPAHHLDAVVIAALWEPSDVAALEQTLAALRPRVGRLIVFGPMPRYDGPVATLLAESMWHHDLGRMKSHLLTGTDQLDAVMRAAVKPFATYVSPWNLLCRAGACRLFVSAGIPMQFDYHHLTRPGAAVLMAALKQEQPDLFGR